MKVYGSTSSPYVRKVRVAAAELGIGDQVQLEVMGSLPHDPNSDLAKKNPGIKVPALELDNGEFIFDSRIIMRYLNDTAGGSLYPAGDWAIQCRESYAEGMIDASLLVRFETALRPEDKRWQEWIDGQSKKVNNVMDQMEQDVAGMTGIDAAAITFGCALGYLDFRFADWGWRDSRPALAAWFADFSARPSMQSAPQV
ncbi:MAG: glutathione S-transferase N-terminal domain-containing protein [Alphaproteobacteria bacterium]|jgi:glutathione S-transferase